MFGRWTIFKNQWFKTRHNLYVLNIYQMVLAKITDIYPDSSSLWREQWAPKQCRTKAQWPFICPAYSWAMWPSRQTMLLFLKHQLYSNSKPSALDGQNSLCQSPPDLSLPFPYRASQIILPVIVIPHHSLLPHFIFYETWLLSEITWHVSYFFIICLPG